MNRSFAIIKCLALAALTIAMLAWCYFAIQLESDSLHPQTEIESVKPPLRSAEQQPIKRVSLESSERHGVVNAGPDSAVGSESTSLHQVARIPSYLEPNDEASGVQFCNVQSMDDPIGYQDDPAARPFLGVGPNTPHSGREPRWNDNECLPWESFAYGEYLGPHRTPHVADYQLRVGDEIDFVYLLNRTRPGQEYRLFPGDIIQVFSANDPTLNQTNVTILSDGTISLPLIGQLAASGKSLPELNGELNERYSEFLRQPSFVVQVVQGDTPLRDVRDAVDARAGQGGQSRQVIVAPDGTVRLPGLGAVPAVGLSLDEIAREVNARYHESYPGLTVTPILISRAPRSIFVLGQVNRPGRVELQGPTTVMQAISMAEGWRTGSNLRQIIVFRRDADWRLMATKIDLQGALIGRSPHPADEIWLRDSDIVLVPKTPVQRFSEAVELYLTRSLYAVFPQQGIIFNFDGFQTF